MKCARFSKPRFLAAVLNLALATGSFAQVAAECTQSVLFSSRTDYVTDTNPVSIATGDFNADRITDLAVTNSFNLAASSLGSSVSILLGRGSAGVGDGTFAAPVYYQAGNKPLYLAAADLNHDGITDVVVSNIGSNNVSVLIGQGSAGIGNGTFSAPTHFPAGTAPSHLLVGDFNEDGIVDVAVANNGTPSISVLLGGGSGGTWNGGFAPPASYPLAQLSTGIASGDFNEDGITDLAASENYGGTIAVLLGQGSGGVGNGTFAPAAHIFAGVEPFDITVDDFNDDGISDLAVVNGSSGGTAILLGNGSGGVGNGTFGAPGFLPSGSSAGSRAADVNQDGITDLLITSTDPYSPGSLRVFLGQGSDGVGNGTFGSQTSYTLGLVPILPALGDFNEDGMLDCAVANYYANNISVLLGTCAGAPPDLRPPQLTRVRDVPNDQGGKVFVTWTRSSLDVPGGAVNSYRVWRRIPPEAAPALASLATEDSRGMLRISHVTHPDGSAGVVYWEALATLPAQRIDGYGYTAPTTQDSMADSNPFTAFFVTALTSNIDVFYDSQVDSGYSVDNLPPQMPESFASAAGATGVTLSWDPNSEGDVVAYRLYRGTGADFNPSPDCLIAAQQNTGYFDPTGTSSHYYKLSAVDRHDNESAFTATSPGGLTAVRDPASRFALEGARPNPATEGNLVVAFSLPSSDPATLSLHDLAGRRWASRSVGSLGAGRHVVDLATGARIPPGIYLVSLTRGAQKRVARAVVAR